MEARAIARYAAATGREREIEALLDAWERSRATGNVSFARVYGPPGIGKSHLLRAVAHQLVDRGCTVIEARVDRNRGEALGLAAQLARGLLAAAAARGVREKELASITARLALLLDGAGAARAFGGRPEDGRLEIADGLAELLRMVLPAAPALLLDDVDAADAGSIDLLQYLAALLLQPGTPSGCLFVLACRDGRTPAPLTALLERLPGLQLPLAPLDAEGVRRFLSRPDVVERLFEATSGEPSRLEAVIAGAPADLGARRIARLEGEARALLLASAVLGHAAPASLLGRVGGVADPSRALERLVSDGFLRVRLEASGASFEIARESDREHVLALAGAERRAALHLAAGEALAEAGGPIEAVARHFLAGDPRGRGAAWAAKAAEQLLARSAFDAAIEFFHAALEGEGVDRRALHLGLAAAYEASGDMIAALRHLGRSRRWADSAQRRESRSEAARLCVRIGKLDQAERLCLRLLDGREEFDPDDPAAARAYVDRAEIRFLRADYEGAMAAAHAGIDRAAGLPRLRLALRNTLGKALLGLGRCADAAAAFRRNREEADAAGLTREAMLACINEGVARHRAGDREAAIGLYREGLALGDDRSLVALALGNLAVLYHEVGAFDLALEHYGNALAAFTLLRRGEGVAHQGINRARLLLFLGDREAALAGVEHARVEAERLGNPYLVAQAQLVRAEIALLAGDAIPAVADLEQARATFERLGNPRYRVEAEFALVRAKLASGDLGGAEAAVDRIAADPAVPASADLSVELLLLRAEVALAAGRAKAALPLLESARVELLERPKGVGGETDLEAPWRLYDLMARAREALGEKEAANAHRVRARTLLEELASRVPAAFRARFVATPLRARLLGEAEAEITPARAGAVRDLAPRGTGPRIVGEAPALRRVLRRIRPLARSLAPVLIRGESGTGKELLAEVLHAASDRAAQPLIKVSCVPTDEEQQLVELFGASGTPERRGRFEQARGGALFLDEIAHLAPLAQAQLLRVIEEGRFERPDGGETIAVDVRLICATSRNLEELKQNGRFREDLYYRLEALTLELPPLRERRDDIPALAEHFLSRERMRRGCGPTSLSPEAISLLQRWDWPGNVRELQNLVATVALFAEGDVLGVEAFELHGDFLEKVRGAPASAPASVAPDGPIDFFAIAQARGIGVRELRHEVEVQMIGRALVEAKGNISEAARLLQMKRSRLSQIVNAEPELAALASRGRQAASDRA